MVHIGFSILLMLVIFAVKRWNDDSIINELFVLAGYTYGPLLGLYIFGFFTKRKIRDNIVPIICIVSPILCYLLSVNSEYLLNGYKFGFELLIVNGLFTFLGLVAISSKEESVIVS